MAALGYAGLGYCIRYEYGMFRQEIENGEQVEHPENWLKEINPWEFPRPDFTYAVPFHGRVTQVTNWKGELDVHWSETDTVNAMAYDMPVIGANAETTGMVRLWSAKATSDFNFAWFNRGDYAEAVEEKGPVGDLVARPLSERFDQYRPRAAAESRSSSSSALPCRTSCTGICAAAWRSRTSPSMSPSS